MYNYTSTIKDSELNFPVKHFSEENHINLMRDYTAHNYGHINKSFRHFIVVNDQRKIINAQLHVCSRGLD